MKKLLTIYLFVTCVSGSYFTAYILFDVWFAPLFFALLTSMLCFVYILIWTKEVNSAVIAGDIVEGKYDKIPVIGKKPITREDYHNALYDLPDMPWSKPTGFDLAKAYYEPKKPL